VVMVVHGDLDGGDGGDVDYVTTVVMMTTMI
jgi:hypothetical protein